METKEYVVQKLMLLSISNNLEIKVNNKEEILSTKDISDLTNEFKEYIELLQLTLNLTSNDLCEMLKISIGTLKSLKGITNKGRRMRTSSLKNFFENSRELISLIEIKNEDEETINKINKISDNFIFTETIINKIINEGIEQNDTGSGGRRESTTDDEQKN